MPESRPVPTIPSKPAVIPLAVLLALNPDENAEPDTGAGQGPAAPQEAAAAVFPMDENSPAPLFFAADTAFDCEPGGGAQEWPAADD